MTLTRFALFAVLSVVPSFSRALTLDCEIALDARAGGYVTERYVFQSEAGASEGIVSDKLILYYNDAQPMSARVAEDTAKKLVLTWTLLLTNRLGQTTKMQFRAAYFKANQSIMIRAVPGGFDNMFEARGRCRPV